jgi:hypothetical protein
LNQSLPPQIHQRKKERRWPFWLGAGLLLVAATLVEWPRIRNASLRKGWEPLEFPISLEKGTIVTPEFRPVLDTDYYMSVQVQRKIEFQRLKCLLWLMDFEYFERCKNAPEALDISWVVTNQGRTIAEGRSQDHHGGSYSDTVARTIGEFRGGKGLICTIKATVNKDASELNQGNPELTVSVHPSVWEADIIAQQIGFDLGCLVGLGGIIILSFGGVAMFLAHRRSRQHWS